MILQWFLFICSLAAMLFGAQFLVKNCVKLAKRFNVSEFVVSFIIIGIGTSLPELLISVMSNAHNMGELVVGNNIGSNIINVFGILGIGALLRPIIMSDIKPYYSDFMFLILASLTISFMVFFPYIGFTSGVVLFSILIVYLIHSAKTIKEKPFKNEPKIIRKKESETILFIEIIGMLFGIAILYFGSEIMMNALGKIIDYYSISQTFAGVLILAPGTSVPELLITVMAAIHSRPKIAIGNILGSNFMNICLVLGAGAILQDFPVSPHILYFDIWIMLAATAILCFDLFYRKKISRKSGALYLTLLGIYFYISLII